MFTKRFLSVVLLIGFVLFGVSAFAFAQKTTLTYWAWGTSGTFTVIKPALEEYSKLHPEIEFKDVIVPYDDYWKKLLAGIAAGESPADFITFHNSQTSRFAQFLEPLPQDLFPLSKMRKEWYAYDQAYVMSDGKAHWTPNGIGGPLIFYNSRMWQEAGLGATPKSWEELRTTAKKLTKYDEEGRVEIAGFQPGGILYGIGYLGIFWHDLLLQQGGWLYNEDGTGADSSWLETPGIKAMTFLRDLIFKDKVFDPEFPTITDSFGTEKSAMAYVWNWISGFTHKNYPELEFGAFTLPTETGKRYPVVGHNNVSAKFAVLKIEPEEKKRKIWKALQWLHEQDDILVRANLAGGFLPGKMSLWNDPRITADPVIKALAEGTPYTIFTGEIPAYFQSEILTNIDIRIFQGMSPEDVLKAAKEEADRLLSENPVAWNVERKYIPPKE